MGMRHISFNILDEIGQKKNIVVGLDVIPKLATTFSSLKFKIFISCHVIPYKINTFWDSNAEIIFYNYF